MKKNKIVFITILSAFIIFTTTVMQTNAATGYQGYAIYRDGAVGGLNWHAGLMDDPYSYNYYPVIHHSGKGYAKIDTWSNFMNGNTFKGVYKPCRDPNGNWKNATSAHRDLFRATARKLASEKIPYNAFYQVKKRTNFF